MSQIVRHCTARSKTTGKQCGRGAIPGGNVCTYHGGKAPQVIDAARRRLAALVDPAIGALEHLISPRNRHAPSRLGAAKDILDRNGHKPADKVEATVATTDLSGTSDAELLALRRALAKRILEETPE